MQHVALISFDKERCGPFFKKLTEYFHHHHHLLHIPAYRKSYLSYKLIDIP